MTHPAYDVTHFATVCYPDGTETGGVAGSQEGVEYWADVYRKRGYTVEIDQDKSRPPDQEFVARWSKPAGAGQPPLDVKNTKPAKANPDPVEFDLERQQRIVDGNLDDILHARQFLYDVELTDKTKAIIRRALARAYYGGYMANRFPTTQ